MKAGLVIWITGLPGSGKSALSDEIKKAFPEFTILRMDELRRVVTPKPTYSETEREMVYRALVFTAKTLSSLGNDVIMDATGNLKKWRGLARGLIPDYAEVYLRCPVDVCIKREGERINTHAAPKAVYEKGKRGWPVPGLSAPYEEPQAPELVMDSDKASLREEVEAVRALIDRMRPAS